MAKIDLPSFFYEEKELIEIPSSLKEIHIKTLIELPSFLTEVDRAVGEVTKNVNPYECTTCQVNCEAHSMCGTCQYCQSACQVSCEGSSMDCTTGCQVSCQTGCEIDCQSTCETGCQTGCQVDSCQQCQSECMEYCMIFCEGCEDSCEWGCMGCEGCETSQCGSCQFNCETDCQNTCQSACQDIGQDCGQSGGGGDKPLGLLNLSIEAVEKTSIGVVATCENAKTYTWSILKSGSWVDEAVDSGSGSYAFNDLKPKTTYTIKCTAKNSTGSKSSTISATTLGDKFEWLRPKESGQPFNLEAYEWNQLQKFVDDVRVSKGKSRWSWTRPTFGGDFTSSMFNQMIDAISDTGGRNLPPEQYQNDQIRADHLNQLVSSINNV